MSRLESAIRRLEAQRDCLDHAVALIAERPGPVLELGLGNGRTFDHLRERLPDREIFVFERQVAAHPDCIPDGDHLILGDVRDTLGAARARIGRPAVLAHLDIGTGDREANARLVAEIAPRLAPLLADGAIIASDQAMPWPAWEEIALPSRVAKGRYHLYRA